MDSLPESPNYFLKNTTYMKAFDIIDSMIVPFLECKD